MGKCCATGDQKLKGNKGGQESGQQTDLKNLKYCPLCS